MPSPFDPGPRDPFDPHSLNMPFEAGPPMQTNEHFHVSGGVVVSSMYLDIATPAGHIKHPAVMFRFAKPDGTGFYPPVMLGPDDVEALRRLPDLVRDAVDHAIASAAS